MEESDVLKPRNTFEVLRWLVFEPDLLKEYSDTVNGWQVRLRAMAWPMFWITAFCFFIYLNIVALIVGFDLPVYFPGQFNTPILESWTNGIWDDFHLVIRLTIWRFIGGLLLGLTGGLLLGLAVGLVGGLAGGLTFGLALGLAAGLMIDLVFGLAYGVAIGLAVSLAHGLGLTFEQGLSGGVIIGLAYCLIGGLFVHSMRILTASQTNSQSVGLTVGLGIILIWFFFNLRLYFYLLYAVLSFFKKYSFEKNPHRRDGVIFFPLPGMQHQFQKEAFEFPEKGFSFSQFLFKRRRFQLQLAWYLLLAGIAGKWQKNRCISTVLKDFPEMDKDAVLQYDVDKDLGIKIDLSRQVIQLPSPDWRPQIETTRQTLLNFELESSIRLRVRYYKTFQEELDRLHDIALRQPKEWGQYFVRALERWQKSAIEKLTDLELEAAAEEPIVENIYAGGEKLKPSVNQDVFLGRSDLRDVFKNRVVTAAQMPLFFIQGQRRVGKSSLIAFLPSILDSGFRVVSVDMQEYPGLAFPALLQKIRERLHEQLFRQEAPAIELPEGWLDCWHVLRQELDDIAEGQEAKIVLAIDEYEELHRILQTDPEQGGRVLGAMRSWSQSQNRVVFLFAGADFLSELRNPNWGEYFVQAERLLVDYLGREDTLKLITLVDLKYPTELLERMWQETQGHPCLLQKICREIVTIVNKTGRQSRSVTEADYDAALQSALLYPDDGVVNIFWNQFCQNRGLKVAVRQILRGEMPEDRQALLVLEDHRFIVRDGTGVRMRVPLFELWLRRYEVT